MSEEKNVLSFKELVKSKESFLGSEIKEVVNNECEKYGDKTFDNIKDFQAVITGTKEGNYAISDKTYYFVKFNAKNKIYFTMRDLEKSPKAFKKEKPNK